jgi:serine/threonine protein kinase
MERAEGIPLNKAVKRLDFDAKKAFRSLLTAVAYLHSKEVCHRDLKPDNMMVNDECGVKLIDFNVAVIG